MPEADRRPRIRSAEVVWALNLLWPGLGNYYASGWSNIRWLLSALVLYVAARSRVMGNLEFALWATAYLLLSVIGHVAVHRHNRRLTEVAPRMQRHGTHRQEDCSAYATRQFKEKFREAGKLLEELRNAESLRAPAGGRAASLESGSASPATASPDENGGSSHYRSEYGLDSSPSSPAGAAPQEGQASEQAGAAHTSSVCLSCGTPRNELRFTCPQCGQFYDL